MKLSVIIVNYNVKYYLEQCLVSLKRALKGMEAEILVVDNDSKDDSAAYLVSRFPEVRFLENHENLGFSRANNKAVLESRSDYVLFLNPDTIVGETTIADTLSFMDNHLEGGAAGVCMLKADGSKAKESRRGLPKPMTAFYKMVGLCAKFPRHPRFGHYYMSGLPWDKPARIEVVSGAFFLVRREALEQVGLFDEDYFMYGEDIDLSYRLLEGGYDNYYIPVRIFHYKGESTQKSSFRYIHVFYDAMLIFLRKHYRLVSIVLYIPLKCVVLLKAATVFIQSWLRKAKKARGLSKEVQNAPSHYVFIGNADTLRQCRELADRNTLSASFVEGNGRTLPGGHLSLDLPKEQKVCVVYDTDAYSFDEIISIFSRRPDANITLGTYNPQTSKILTAMEVIA